MGNFLESLLTICGIGLVATCGIVIFGALFMVFTGRALLLSALFSAVPQMIGGILGLFTGGGNRKRRSPSRSKQEERSSRSQSRSQSAADRIRAKRDSYSDSAPAPRPRQDSGVNPGTRDPRSAAGQSKPSQDNLTPKSKQWEQGGRRGPIKDRYEIRGPESPSAPDTGGVGRRDSRKNEGMGNDEIFGGMLDGDGDGFIDG